ncbi:hypothetical protein KY334_03725 [Candidatus Woesearchaeota archaeon]|nr:hypothetical protein [Candidatus Woesearchaeota archaeon]
MNKKAMSTMALNWVFVAIAGSLILLFAVKIINTQGKISDLEITSKILEDLGSTLVGKSTNEGSFSIIKIPSDKILDFQCNNVCNERVGCESYVKTVTSEKQIPTEIRPIFAPERVKFSRELYSFVESWRVPFNVVNFVYLSFPGENLIFPDNPDCDGNCRRILARIPDKVKDAEIVIQSSTPNGPEFSNSKFKKVIEFLSNCDESTYQGRKICVNSNNITFYDSEGNKEGSFNYLTDEEILAAIFTQDSQTYECNMRKSEYKYSQSVSTYSKKAGILKKEYNSVNNCNVGYNAMINYLSDYTLDDVDFFKKLNDIKKRGLHINFENQNYFVISNGCPPLY